MKKKVKKLFIELLLVFVLIFSVNAAGVNTSTTSLSMKNIARLAEVMTNIRKRQVYIINTANCKNSSASYVVRIYVEAIDRMEDYALTIYPYQIDPVTSKQANLPFNTVEEGNAIFGPNWYYYGIYTQQSPSLSGFVVAERIDSWPTWENLSFSGKTNRGVRFEGSYLEKSDKNYIAMH